MAVLLRFTPDGMTAEKYHDILQRLETAGEGSPPGRLYHVAFGDANNLRVSDIWDSMESFARFAETLKPIMQEVGISGEPELIEVHNILVGEQAKTTTG